jgi:hypothetical protein
MDRCLRVVLKNYREDVEGIISVPFLCFSQKRGDC